MLAPGFLHPDAPTTLVKLDAKLRRITCEFQAYIGNHQSQLARKLGCKPQTVQSWFRNGRISARGAHTIGKHFPDWPRTRLRPDVVDWKQALRSA